MGTFKSKHKAMGRPGHGAGPRRVGWPGPAQEVRLPALAVDQVVAILLDLPVALGGVTFGERSRADTYPIIATSDRACSTDSSPWSARVVCVDALGKGG